MSRNAIFRDYTARNYIAWHAFARAQGLDVDPTDLLLVSGYVKTTAWILAAFTERGVTHSIYLSAQGVGGAEAEVGSLRQTSVIQRDGPKRHQIAGSPNAETRYQTSERCDQCLFLRYYKAQHRLNLPWGPFGKIVAGADPEDDQFSDDTEGSSTCKTESTVLGVLWVSV